MKFDLRTTKGKERKAEMSDDTFWSKRLVGDHLRSGSHAVLDDAKRDRLSRNECIACYYFVTSFSWAGQAFTEYKCQLCDKESMYHNTNTPKYCEECSKDNNMCVRCGSELYERSDVQLS